MRKILPLSFAAFSLLLTLGLFAPKRPFYLSPSEYVDAVHTDNLDPVMDTLYDLRMPFIVKNDGKGLQVPSSLMEKIVIKDDKITVKADGMAFFQYLHYRFGLLTQQFFGLPSLRKIEKWYDAKNLELVGLDGKEEACLSLHKNLERFFNNPKHPPKIIKKNEYMSESDKGDCEIQAKSGVLNLTINSRGFAKVTKANQSTYLSCTDCL